MVRVHHLDVARHHDVAGLDGRGTGRRKLKPLRAFAFHLERDLLHVEDDVGDIFAHAGEAREFVQHVLDLDRRDSRTLERREQHAAQRVAKRQAKAALERFGDEGRLALAVAASLDFQVAGLLQFLPVPDIDSHGFPFALGGTGGGRLPVQRGFLCGRRPGGEARPKKDVRRGGAWPGGRHCAGSASRRGST